MLSIPTTSPGASWWCFRDEPDTSFPVEDHRRFFERGVVVNVTIGNLQRRMRPMPKIYTPILTETCETDTSKVEGTKIEKKFFVP